MKCPQCNNDLEVDNVCFINADMYSNTVNVVTRCCKKMVRIQPIRKYRVTPNDTDIVDDWGDEVQE